MRVSLTRSVCTDFLAPNSLSLVVKTSSCLLGQGEHLSQEFYEACFRVQGQGREVRVTFPLVPFSPTSSASDIQSASEHVVVVCPEPHHVKSQKLVKSKVRTCSLLESARKQVLSFSTGGIKTVWYWLRTENRSM